MRPLPAALEEQRKRCVIADAAQKRSAHRYTNRGLSPPPSLLRREVEAFDRHHSLQYGEGNSSDAGSSSSPRTPLPAPKIKDDNGFEEYDPVFFGGSIGREDFVPDEAMATVIAMLLQHSAREEEVETKCRRLAMDIDDLLLEQGLDCEREILEKKDDWEREKTKQKAIYVDLVCDDSDDE